MFVFRDQELVFLAIEIGDDQALLALGLLAEGHRAGDFSQRAGIFWRPRFEQFGHPRQAAGDVARLLRLGRNPRQHLADANQLTVAHDNQRADREADRDRVFGARDLHFLRHFVEQLDLRPHALDHGAAALGVDHHQRRQTGNLIDLLGHRHALFDVLELHRAAVFGDDRPRQRIPVRQLYAGLDALTILHIERRAIGHLVPLALAAVVIDHGRFAGARNHDLLAPRVGDVAHRAREAHPAAALGLDMRDDRRARRRAADVERAHRQLGARFADRLRGNDTDRLAGIDQRAAAQIAAITLGAQAVARFA